MVCYVVLHYMVTSETVACVESILGNVKGEKKIVVVDNASPNGSFKELEERYGGSEEVCVIKTQENLGFARGNNFGYKYALENFSPRFTVVLNNDTEIFQSDFQELIEKSFSEYSYYILGPDIYSTKKGYHQNPQTRKMPTYKELEASYKKLRFKNAFKFLLRLKSLFARKEKQSPAPAERGEGKINYTVINPLLHGSCYVFSPLFMEKHKDGCFYDKTFMYMEAEILCYSAIKNNELMIYYPLMEVDHHEDAATDSRYKKRYKKSVFSVKCLMQSAKAFMELMQEYGDEKSERIVDTRKAIEDCKPKNS